VRVLESTRQDGRQSEFLRPPRARGESVSESAWTHRRGRCKRYVGTRTTEEDRHTRSNFRPCRRPNGRKGHVGFLPRVEWPVPARRYRRESPPPAWVQEEVRWSPGCKEKEWP